MNPVLSEYSDSIYVAKGIAIILVVIGHYHPPHIPQYWQWLHDFIYTFHMPIFMLLSGFLFAAGAPINSISQYKNLIKNKSKRLLLPFLSIAILIFIIKSVAALHFKLTYPISSQSLINLFLNPIDSYASILWFLYVSFEVFLIFPLIYHFIKSDIHMLVIFILLSFLPWFSLFMVGELLFFLPLFTLGLVLFRHDILMENYKFGLTSLLVFVLFIAFNSFFQGPDLLRRLYRLALGGLGAVATFFIAIQISRTKNCFSRALRRIGIYSMGIYLLHTPIMNGVKLVTAEQFSLSGHWFLPIALIMITVGTGVPMLIEGRLLRRSALATQLILGIKLKKV